MGSGSGGAPSMGRPLRRSERSHLARAGIGAEVVVEVVVDVSRRASPAQDQVGLQIEGAELQVPAVVVERVRGAAVLRIGPDVVADDPAGTATSTAAGL